MDGRAFRFKIKAKHKSRRWSHELNRFNLIHFHCFCFDSVDAALHPSKQAAHMLDCLPWTNLFMQRPQKKSWLLHCRRCRHSCRRWRACFFCSRGASAAPHWWPALTGGSLAASSSASKLWSAHIGKSITNLTKAPCADTQTHTICNSPIYFSTHCFSFQQHCLAQTALNLWCTTEPHPVCVCACVWGGDREFVCMCVREKGISRRDVVSPA